MKIRCIANTGASLPEHYLDPSGGYTKDLKYGLTIGKEYVVYAFYEWKDKSGTTSLTTIICITRCKIPPRYLR